MQHESQPARVDELTLGEVETDLRVRLRAASSLSSKRSALLKSISRSAKITSSGPLF